MGSEFYSEKIVTVRKPRQCAGCCQMLAKGDQALVYSGKFDGDFGSFTLHPECRVAELAWNKMADTYYDEFVSLSELEPDEWEWLLDEHPVVAARMNITAERIADHRAERQRISEFYMAQARKHEAERQAALAARAMLRTTPESEELPDGCPSCGALPCDWVNDPRALSAEVEALRSMLTDMDEWLSTPEKFAPFHGRELQARVSALLNKEPAR